jgi:hypothetical protein
MAGAARSVLYVRAGRRHDLRRRAAALVDQEILQQELAVTPFERAAAALAGHLDGIGLGFDLDHPVGGATVRAIHSRGDFVWHATYGPQPRAKVKPLYKIKKQQSVYQYRQQLFDGAGFRRNVH